jgi:hypothetical protein
MMKAAGSVIAVREEGIAIGIVDFQTEVGDWRGDRLERLRIQDLAGQHLHLDQIEIPMSN